MKAIDRSPRIRGSWPRGGGSRLHGNASGAPGDTLFVPGSHGRTVPTLSSNGLSRLSDWDLIHGALQARPAGGGGPNEPFAVLFARYASRIYSFLSRRTGDPAIAEDLTQETFLAAYRKLDRLRPERVAGGPVRDVEL